MRDGEFFLRFIRDNLPVLVFFFMAAVLVGGWVIFESARNLLRGDEGERLRRRGGELEREHAKHFHPGVVAHVTSDPVALSPRWVAKGGAATTTDGGCLLVVDDVIAKAAQALLTVRIDGVAASRREAWEEGQTREYSGKLGTYTVQLGPLAGAQAQLSVWLRNRHRDSADAVMA